MTKKTLDETANPFLQLQNAGLGNMMGMNSEWIAAIGEIQAEVVEFIAHRIKEDVKTQHQILQCKTVSDLQHVQAQFVQTAVDQYQEETGKLIEMGKDALNKSAKTDAGID